MIFITLSLHYARLLVNLYSIYEKYKNYKSKINACYTQSLSKKNSTLKSAFNSIKSRI